jgi:RNA ligase (TIGR02306 family)
MRKLASIQVVENTYSIPKSDFLELIKFKNIGWQCVSTKGTFKSGDLAVFFEVDSFLPLEDERFKFLEKTSLRKMYTGIEGYRLKTLNLRKTLSQGLVLPIAQFPELKDKKPLEDVTELLNVTKWEREPVFSLNGDIISDYPGHTPKSHQDRIQNVPEYFELYKDVVFERTMKLEGTSQSYHILNGEISVSSHNATFAKNDKFEPWTYAVELGLDKALLELNKNITLQGEFMGPKIQGNIEHFEKHKFFVYNIWDIDNGGWLTPSERYSFIEKINSLMDKELLHVPILDKEIKIFSVVSSLDELLVMADGKSINAKYREGDVYKSVEKINGHYIQFKVISNKYLLKEKD